MRPYRVSVSSIASQSEYYSYARYMQPVGKCTMSALRTGAGRHINSTNDGSLLRPCRKRGRVLMCDHLSLIRDMSI